MVMTGQLIEKGMLGDKIKDAYRVYNPGKKPDPKTFGARPTADVPLYKFPGRALKRVKVAAQTKSVAPLDPRKQLEKGMLGDARDSYLAHRADHKAKVKAATAQRKAAGTDKIFRTATGFDLPGHAAKESVKAKVKNISIPVKIVRKAEPMSRQWVMPKGMEEIGKAERKPAMLSKSFKPLYSATDVRFVSPQHASSGAVGNATGLGHWTSKPRRKVDASLVMISGSKRGKKMVQKNFEDSGFGGGLERTPALSRAGVWQ